VIRRLTMAERYAKKTTHEYLIESLLPQYARELAARLSKNAESEYLTKRDGWTERPPL